jgi:toxin ParE1/3/4
MPRVLRTPMARRDLKEIGEHLAQESQSRRVALQFLDRIAKKCELHATQPELGEACPDLGAHVRRFAIGNYVVFFRPLRDGIEVLRVLHGNRDISTVWRKQ